MYRSFSSKTFTTAAYRGGHEKLLQAPRHVYGTGLLAHFVYGRYADAGLSGPTADTAGSCGRVCHCSAGRDGWHGQELPRQGQKLHVGVDTGSKPRVAGPGQPVVAASGALGPREVAPDWPVGLFRGPVAFLATSIPLREPTPPSADSLLPAKVATAAGASLSSRRSRCRHLCSGSAPAATPSAGGSKEGRDSRHDLGKGMRHAPRPVPGKGMPRPKGRQSVQSL